MAVSIAQWLVGLAGVYTLVGVFVAVPFVFSGVSKIDASAREGTLGFRLLILPGTVALWPLVLRRWRGGTPPPEECNAHREAARARAKEPTS